MKKWVYIASPYTIGNQYCNVQTQLRTANKLYDAGFIPIAPLLNTVYCHAQQERSWEFWLSICFALLDKCDIVFRCPGESKGADAEVAHAFNKGLQVFTDINVLIGSIT